ncbi:T9SS type A sorting domain-containing protein [Gelidibacter algens]|nr:T9SS type A sorting domain-containing protein [Gelidibacter algens]OBX25155.1 hypothetical protein A9996_11690 [Gelidibacter algens]
MTLFLMNVSAFSQCWQSITDNGGTAHAIRTDGTLWGWGENAGQLGIGFTPTIAFISAPTQVGTDTDWMAVEEGYDHVLALKTDGTLWAWGNNNYGALGDGTNVWSWSPVQIGTDSNWQSISAGSDLSLALKTDGTIWAWGINNHGQLGDNNQFIDKHSPTQVGIETNWAKIEVGLGHAGAIKSDGTLWVWGLNTNGQVGNSSLNDQVVPVQIETFTDWQTLNLGGVNSAGIRMDGTLWAWGANAQGQSGSLSPVQVGTETNWSDVSSGNRFTLGLKTNGTLWSWGDNSSGQLGHGNLTSVYTPTQIGVDSDWQTIEAGLGNSFATKSDATLWGWGYNYYGNLGNGDSGNQYNSPIDVICSALSVEESLLGEVKIYPNPTKDVIHFETTSNSHFNILVYDIFAKQIAQFQDINIIDISNLSSGMYVVKLSNPQTSQTIIRKIIKI